MGSAANGPRDSLTAATQVLVALVELQTALSDSYVAYRLVVCVDATDPATPKLVPESKWFTAPARRPMAV
ncbi:MAG: hypothetical protein IPP44_22800 [Ideonella sp.]|nr:hypothetical protein [Ideonella sp.]